MYREIEAIVYSFWFLAVKCECREIETMVYNFWFFKVKCHLTTMRAGHRFPSGQFLFSLEDGGQL